MSGRWKYEKTGKSEKNLSNCRIANDIQVEIISKNLNAALRTVCKRTAFQDGKDQSLRFSIDYNFHIIDELQTQRKKGKK